MTNRKLPRRAFLEASGKSFGLATAGLGSVGTLLKEVAAATRSVEHLTPEQVAMDEDYDLYAEGEALHGAVWRAGLPQTFEANKAAHAA